ncbi:MAG TPA: hypothetical protein VMD07_04420 [Candidatus Acidoferrales bacterium]|nr:hypothetical protein [Candidatus Acidoferrales bacterium]
MPKAPHRALLTDFLKSRRARLRPDDVGLPEGDARGRRTPGLRRAEVARLADISTEWYTLFEMGRDRAMTQRIIEPVARALRLNRVERDYVYTLLRAEPPPPRGVRPIHPSLEYSLKYTRDAAVLVYDPWLTRVRANAVAEKVFLHRNEEWVARNVVWRTFKDDALRKMMGSAWEEHTRRNLGLFRRSLARDPESPAAKLVLDALRGNADFERLWAAHDVSSFDQLNQENLTKPYAITHPTYGAIAVHSMVFPVAGWPGAHTRYLTPADDAAFAAFRNAGGVG